MDLIATLVGMYEKFSMNNKVCLVKKLFDMKMLEDMSITQHLNELNNIKNQLSSVEIDIYDHDIKALILIASLPNS